MHSNAMFIVMAYDWLPRAIVPVSIAIVMALFRRYAPPPPEPSSLNDYKHHQTKEPLPPGAIGASMWGIGAALALSFFVLRWMNRLWANTDGPAILRTYATTSL